MQGEKCNRSLITQLQNKEHFNSVFFYIFKQLVPVVQKVDFKCYSLDHVNLYPLDIYPVDSTIQLLNNWDLTVCHKMVEAGLDPHSRLSTPNIFKY